MRGMREVALIGGIVLVASVYLLALLVAVGPSNARSAPHRRDLTKADFVRMATKTCGETKAALGSDAVRNGGTPASRAALAKEAAATRSENRALAALVARTRTDRVRLARFVREHGRVVTTLRLAARERDVKQASDLVRVAYGRVSLSAGELGLAPCGLG